MRIYYINIGIVYNYTIFSGGGNMMLYSNFNYKIDRDRVLNSVGSYWKLPPRNEAERVYDYLFDELFNLKDTRALVNITKKPREYNFNFLRECTDIFLCGLTVGDESTRRVDEFFNRGMLLEGVMMDAMASMLLFECVGELQEHLSKEAVSRGMGLTCRICPGDGEIPIELQGDILSRIGDTKAQGIYIQNGYVLNPAKSMTFVYGAGDKIKTNLEENSCSSCFNKYCSMRKE